jgi:hypothetical protein
LYDCFLIKECVTFGILSGIESEISSVNTGFALDVGFDFEVIVITLLDHSNSFIIDAFAPSQRDNMITNDEIPIIIPSVDKNERSLFAKIDKKACFINR